MQRHSARLAVALAAVACTCSCDALAVCVPTRGRHSVIEPSRCATFLLAKKKASKPQHARAPARGFGGDAAGAPGRGLSGAAAGGPVRAPTPRERTFLKASPHNSGMALLANGKFEEAGLAFEAALEREPDAPETWSALGVCLTELGQPAAALVCQKQVLRIRGAAEHGGAERAKEHEFRALASDPARLPALPGGGTLSIRTGNLTECDTGGRVWSSAPVLCRWMATIAGQIAGSAVCELGCGTGAVGLFAASLGAARVVLTDGGPPAVIALAAANAEANAHLWPERTRVETARLAWGPPEAERPDGVAAEDLPCDWVLGSDVTYSEGAHAALCWTVRRLLERGSALPRGGGERGTQCRAVLAHEVRVPTAEAADERLEHFVARAAEAGLRVSTLHTEHEGAVRVSLLELHVRG